MKFLITWHFLKQYDTDKIISNDKYINCLSKIFFHEERRSKLDYLFKKINYRNTTYVIPSCTWILVHN